MARRDQDGRQRDHWVDQEDEAPGRMVGGSTMKPPMGGPAAADMAEKPAQVPIARPRSSSSNAAPMIASEHGIKSAAPTPCTARAASSCAALAARPHHSDAAAKIAVPMMKTRRRPSRSPAAPPISRNALSESV